MTRERLFIDDADQPKTISMADLRAEIEKMRLSRLERLRSRARTAARVYYVTAALFPAIALPLVIRDSDSSRVATISGITIAVLIGLTCWLLGAFAGQEARAIDEEISEHAARQTPQTLLGVVDPR